MSIDAYFDGKKVTERWVDKALELNPQFGEAWLNKGNALDNSGKHEEAIKCYEKALEINPKYRRYLESCDRKTIRA